MKLPKQSANISRGFIEMRCGAMASPTKNGLREPTSIGVNSSVLSSGMELGLTDAISEADLFRAIPNAVIGRVTFVPYGLLVANEPTAHEQYMLELINRMRMNPAAELPLLTNASEQNIDSAIEYFNLDLDVLADQWNTLIPAQPLAWSAELKNVAFRNNQLQIKNDTAGHYTGGWQNAFAYAKSVLYGHAAFGIDWGDEKTGDNNRDGIQDSLGHRDNILNGSHEKVGISIISEKSPNKDVGPLLITQNFGRKSAQPWLLGVVYRDANGNKFYDPGEGLKGINVEVVRLSDNQRATTTTMSAGGYQIRLEAGDYAVTFSGSGLSFVVTKMVTIRRENVKLDVTEDGASSEPDLVDDGNLRYQFAIDLTEDLRLEDEPAQARLMHYAPLYDAPDPDKEGYTRGHNIMFKKAIDYLKGTDSLTASYPLDRFLPFLAKGSWYADHSGPAYDWKFYTGRGDQIHHYGKVGEIEIQEDWIDRAPILAGAAIGWSIFGPVGALVGTAVGAVASDDRVTVGHTGDYAAPYYAQVLYEQALKFWPGNATPSLSELPVKNAGFADCPVICDGKAVYGETRVGGYPLAPASSPRWPDWPGATKGGEAVQSWMNSLTYLGWAIHLLQDVTVPQNAANYANNESNKFEDLANENILHNLPSGPLKLTFNSIEDLGQQIVNLSAASSGKADDVNVRQQADLAMQVTAAVIDKFFGDLEAQPLLRMELQTLYRRKEEFKRSHPGAINPGYLDILKKIREKERQIQARIEDLTRIHGKKVDLVPRRIIVKEETREFGRGNYLQVGVEFQNIGNWTFTGNSGEVEISNWPGGTGKVYSGLVYGGGRPGEVGGELGKAVGPGEFGALWFDAPLGSLETGKHVLVHLDPHKTMQRYRVDKNDKIFDNDSAKLLVLPPGMLIGY